MSEVEPHDGPNNHDYSFRQFHTAFNLQVIGSPDELKQSSSADIAVDPWKPYLLDYHPRLSKVPV
ncbi:hypothetical protein [Rhizobium leguminosarum]|uniref:hypothetical protein n=1 Tax=Rhizobium leguminosarum TaxID=384 RepID=UPI0021BC1DD5|nr:hypothetical protein [Rhizobium leguminosarum]